MIISCNECDSSFMVDDSLIKDTGSKVRCSNCSSVFVAYPQPPETDESGEFDLEGLDTSLENLEEGDESFESEGLLDGLELDLDDFDEEPGQDAEPETEDLADDIDGEFELGLDLDDDDDTDLNMLDDGGDELPDLSDFEDLAGLDDDSLTMDDPDEALEDIGLVLESETDATAEVEETDLELDSDEELNLADLDFEAEDDAEAEVEDADQLDLSDLEFELDDNDALDDSADGASGEFKFDLEEQPPAKAETAEAGATVEDADQLDLSDLELQLEDNDAFDDSADGASGEFDLDLEAQPPEKAETAEAGAAVEDFDELDLSTLEIELDESAASNETAAAGSGDLELNLDLNEDAEAVAIGNLTDEDQPDLSDLQLESDDSAAAASDDLDLNLDDLDLSLDEEADTVAVGSDELDLSDMDDILSGEETSGDQPGSQDAAENLELDLDLTLDEDAQSADAGEALADDLDLDLSDLEQIIETDDTTTADTAADNGADELDLEFNLDEPPAAPAAADASQNTLDDDLLDIEKMLEQGDDIESESEQGDGEEFSLTMEETLGEASQEAEPDFDLDFDIESELQEKKETFDSGTSDDDGLDSNLLDADDLDFLDDVGSEVVSQEVDSDTDDFSIDEFADNQDAYGQTDVLPDIDAGVPEPAKPAKSRSKKPAFAVLMLLLLAAGALILPKSLGIHIPYLSDIKIPYISDIDIKIPYLSDWLNPQAQDVSGSLKITPMDQSINGRFVDNSKVGRLFVIRGKIRNEYDHPRSFVKVTGKLYQKGQKLAKSATVYCGNVIPESDLTRMDIAAIQKRMKNKSGTKRSNHKIKTGKTIPFMIVFDKLPDNLDEYTVEVASSSI